MARHESDREDLMREATALVERAELQIAGFEEPIVVGFRKDGAASVFFGADPVYQFNMAGELRRAYVGGLLYKAERRRLVALRRERGEHETALVRRELSESEMAAFLAAMRERLAMLADAMTKGAYSVSGQWPENGDVDKRIHHWVAELPELIAIAGAPNVA